MYWFTTISPEASSLILTSLLKSSKSWVFPSPTPIKAFVILKTSNSEEIFGVKLTFIRSESFSILFPKEATNILTFPGSTSLLFTNKESLNEVISFNLNASILYSNKYSAE